MPLDITFTLSDQDLEHFQTIVDKAKAAMDSDQSAAQIEAAARQLIEDATATELPDFISDRLAKLQVVINMLSDSEWDLGEEDRKRVLGALLYFCVSSSSVMRTPYASSPSRMIARSSICSSSPGYPSRPTPSSL